MRPARVRISAAQPHANLRILASARNKIIQLRKQIRSSNIGERPVYASLRVAVPRLYGHGRDASLIPCAPPSV
ncbi:hypothetical protein NDU88_006911 [Pleurodeles waltl]|uniref:Uncharacterized protein n=1 Tax=Pleurodeles waltl TaxID=8319 RepID=A0AAV7TZY3_PLEWA|nr:hypothetical protein NDU88_006911 [Pleurodeles waltl]